MFWNVPKLEKMVRIGSVQVCQFGEHILYFTRLDSGVWEQSTACNNRLEYRTSHERPLVLYADAWLASDDVIATVSRADFGVFIYKR